MQWPMSGEALDKESGDLESDLSLATTVSTAFSKSLHLSLALFFTLIQR